MERPSDVTEEDLKKAREAAAQQLADVPSFGTYQREATHLPRWNCGSCGTRSIACSQGECPNCNSPRPSSHHDAHQEGGKGGFLRRRRGRGTHDRNDISGH